MIELGLVLLLIGLCWWLRPENVRRRWLQHIARHSKDPAQQATAVRLLAVNDKRDLHS